MRAERVVGGGVVEEVGEIGKEMVEWRRKGGGKTVRDLG